MTSSLSVKEGEASVASSLATIDEPERWPLPIDEEPSPDVEPRMADERRLRRIPLEFRNQAEIRPLERKERNAKRGGAETFVRVSTLALYDPLFSITFSSCFIAFFVFSLLSLQRIRPRRFVRFCI